MSFKHIKILILVLFVACYQFEDWEDVEESHSPVLNVFGLLSLDPDINSFVQVYRTTNLSENSQVFVGVDTFRYSSNSSEYYLDSLYEPASIIKDARVIVYSDKDTFKFNFVEFGWEDDFRINRYIDTSGLFIPQADSVYYLEIDVQGYDNVTGSLKMPPIPVLIDSATDDTIYTSESYSINWEPIEDLYGSLNGYLLDYVWICSAEFKRILLLDTGSYYRQVEFCEEVSLEDSFNENSDFQIKLTTMDNNYYQYFAMNDNLEYSNFLLDNSANSGKSCGISGGYGVFGGISSSSLYRIIVEN